MTDRPASGIVSESLSNQLRALALPRGVPVLVHCSLKSMGPALPEPKAASLLATLRDAWGESTTLVVPTHTANNSTTSPDYLAATGGMSREEIVEYRDAMPGFDPDRTPAHRVGRFAEYLRTSRGAVRSSHPQTSFAALGPDAPMLMKIHELDCHLGDRSPVGALYASHAWVMLLGVGYAVCTGFHLAEYHLPRPVTKQYECFVQADGVRVHHEFVDLDFYDKDFDELGTAMERELGVHAGPVGAANACAFPLRNAVDFAIGWLADHRGL